LHLSNWRRDDIVTRIPIAEDRSMDLQDLVQEDAGAGTFRIHRSTMTSAEILRLEQERIFDRCWLYVGHDSEVAKNGDFIRRTIGGRPLFMMRGLDGVVRTFIAGRRSAARIGAMPAASSASIMAGPSTTAAS
jgi:hypothetical protein